MSRLVEARKKLLGRYIARLQETVEELDALWSAETMDVERVADLAHKLRGSGGTYGFDKITAAAGHVEEADAAHIRDALRALIDVCSETVGASEAKSASAPALPADGPLVMIVEDDPSLAEVVAAFVGTLGYSPQVAATVAAAREMLAEATPEIVVFDMMLPDGDGFDVLTLLRSRTGPRPAALALTMIDDEQTRVAIQDAGAAAYLTKPFRPDVFAENLNAVVRPSARRSAAETLERREA